ncbi:MAG: hypoxanthine phosphoribosyltransferase [Candidatus Scalindua sp.]
MKNGIGEVIITETEIEHKVSDLAQRITADYEHKGLTIIGVLNGSLIFFSDLIRHIPLPVKIDTVRANTYIGVTTIPTAETDIFNNISLNIKDEHVLIVDDILDTGKTLSMIVQVIKGHNPKSVKVCVLLNKEARREVEIVPDYCCFEVENKFVVGYGLDFDNKYRNLPYIAVLVP